MLKAFMFHVLPFILFGFLYFSWKSKTSNKLFLIWSVKHLIKGSGLDKFDKTKITTSDDSFNHTRWKHYSDFILTTQLFLIPPSDKHIKL